MVTSTTFYPDEILAIPFVLPQFLRVIVNVDDLSNHMLTVRFEVVALKHLIRSMMEIIMFVVRKSSDWYLVSMRMESSSWIMRRTSRQQRVPTQQTTNHQCYLRQ